MPLVRVETLIRAPPARCFDLMRDPSLHVASQASSGERIVEGRTNGLFESGDIVTWEARHFGIRQRLTVRILRCEPPRIFVDEMVRGAFAFMRHTHEFIAVEGGTRMIDLFDYRAPLGVLGRVADAMFLERYMRELVEDRADFIRREAERRIA